MATPQGCHAGSVLPGMESTPVQRTTDSSFVGPHYANLGAIAAQQIEGGVALKVTQDDMEKFLVHVDNHWLGGEQVWLTGNGEECLKKVMGKTKYTTSQYGPHELRVHTKSLTFRMVMSDNKDYVYFEPKIFGERMLQTIDTCDVE